MLRRVTMLWLLIAAIALPASLDAQPGGLKNLRKKLRSGPSAAKRTDPGEAGARWPGISPDGTTIAFALHGDLWAMPVEGGRATRLTLNEANDIKPVWSPDGKTIAFTSDRSGSFDVWTMPADGGVPTQITFDGATDHVSEFSPDGKTILFQSTREQLTWRLYTIPVSGGTPTLVTLDSPATDGSFTSDGEWVYYNRASSDGKVKGYRGSMNDELYRCKPGEIPEQLTSNDQNDREPNISPDGKTLYFTRETGKLKRDYNLFAMDVESGDVKQLSDLDENGMSYVSLDDACENAYFIWKFRIYSLDLTDEKAKPELLAAEIVEDTRRPEEITQTTTAGAESCDLSRDGQSLVFELGGGIWIMNAGGGQARSLTPTGSGDHMPRFSPDGRWVAFYSSRRGNDDLWLVSSNGQTLRQITFDPSADHFHNWSPDGSYLVFSSERTGNREIFKVAIDGSAPEQLTKTAYSDDDPSVSPDGTLIAYDSWPNGNADIHVMNADGTNVRRVYGTPAQEESPRFSPNGRLLVFNRTTQGGIGITREVVVTDLAGSGEVVVAAGHDGAFSPDGKEIVYIDMEGHIKAVPAPQDISGGRTIGFIASESIKQKDLFLRSFDEAWNLVNQNFYVTDFHGIDWNEMRSRYRPMIANCKTRMEYYFYMTAMIGELSASHQGIYGPISDLTGFSTGILGCELTPEVMDQEEGARGEPRIRLRISNIEKGGAVDRAWLREGDYIFGAPGRLLDKNTSFSSLMRDTGGKTVTLIVGANADGTRMRAVQIAPENSGQAQQRRYMNWLTECRTKTKEEGEGKVAYIHIPAMNPQALNQFQNELASPQVQACKALVLDVRNNGGGNIHQQLYDILTRKHYAVNFSRGQQQNAPALFWDRPIVLLINTSSYSDAEVFPHGFRALGLGTIVGEPTPGAVIGTVNLPLSDGSTFRVTRLGFRNLDGTNQEGNGAQPDVLVAMTAEDRIEGNDPQLDRAIEIALGDIEREAEKRRQEIAAKKKARDEAEAAAKKAADDAAAKESEVEKPAEKEDPKQPKGDKESVDQPKDNPKKEPKDATEKPAKDKPAKDKPAKPDTEPRKPKAEPKDEPKNPEDPETPKPPKEDEYAKLQWS